MQLEKVIRKDEACGGLRRIGAVICLSDDSRRLQHNDDGP